jgi:hypothetical protein
VPDVDSTRSMCHWRPNRKQLLFMRNAWVPQGRNVWAEEKLILSRRAIPQ